MIKKSSHWHPHNDLQHSSEVNKNLTRKKQKKTYIHLASVHDSDSCERRLQQTTRFGVAVLGRFALHPLTVERRFSLNVRSTKFLGWQICEAQISNGKRSTFNVRVKKHFWKRVTWKVFSNRMAYIMNGLTKMSRCKSQATLHELLASSAPESDTHESFSYTNLPELAKITRIHMEEAP